MQAKIADRLLSFANMHIYHVLFLDYIFKEGKLFGEVNMFFPNILM